MVTKKSVSNIRHLAAILLLAPLFFQRVFIGAEVGDSYKDYPGFELRVVGYACHFGLIFFPLFHAKLNRAQVNWTRILVVFLFLGMLSNVHLFITSETTGFSVIQLATPLLRGYVWLFAIASYICIYFDRETLVDVFRKFCRFSSWISIICIALYFLFNFPFGVLLVGVTRVRVHGFFSEPSALASVFPGFVLIGFFKKNYKDVILGLTALLFSASVIVYIVTIVLFISGYVLKQGKTAMFTAFLSFYTAVMVLAPIILNQEIATIISEQAESLMSTYSSIDADGLVFQVFISRVLFALSVLSDVLSSYSPDNLASSGSLARLIGPIITIDLLHQSGLYFFGFGLNIFGYISDRSYGGVLDFGLFPFLLSSFGLPFAIVLFIVLTHTVRRIALADSTFGSLIMGNFFAVLINSAAGIHGYTLPVLALMTSLFGANRLFEQAKKVVKNV